MLSRSLLFVLLGCATKETSMGDTSAATEDAAWSADGELDTDGDDDDPASDPDDDADADGSALDGLDSDGGEGDDTGLGTGGGDSGDGTPTPALEGFIGSPCATDSDCPYDGGVCLTDGFPEGHCSASCDLYCPDADGYPVTFCVDADVLPDPSLTGGWCVTRCSFGYYSEDGCRDEYGCTVESRYGEPGTETYACMPGEGTDLSSCHEELIARGVGFEPTIRSIDFPDGRPDKECEIIDPVWVESPLFGVDLKYYNGDPTHRVLAGCEMAHSLADTIEDVAPLGVSAVRHIGTYNCRMIGGTDMLSEHSFANAIDIFGFEFDDGRLWTLEDHWEHDTTAPSSEAARFLYDAAHRWYDDWIWNIILTPNYDLAHDNHFHVDLKDGYHDLSVTSGRYIGPALYVD